MTEDKSSQPKKGGTKDGAIGFVGLLLLVACMAVSYYYPYPSGKRPDFLSLLMLWAREAIILVVALAGLVVLGISAGIKFIRSLREPGAERKS
jgi:uncharacterized membrane protein